MTPRLFAVVPAAGESRRMGRPKLLLPLGGKTVLALLLDVLRPVVDAAFVVIRPGDEPLAQEAAACGAVVVRPDRPPPDMRCSVEEALRWISERCAPTPDDAWLLAPADHPALDPLAVEAVVDRWRRSAAAIVVPTHAGKRGHPTLLSWGMSSEVSALPPDAGLNQLVRRNADRVIECPVESPTALLDLDTPEDYEALRRRYECTKASEPPRRCSDAS